MSTESNLDVRTIFLGAVSSEETQRAHVASHVGLSKGSGSPTENRQHKRMDYVRPHGSWTFAAVLDGATTKTQRPLLATELSQSPQLHLDDNVVARLLIKAVTEVDSRIADDFKSLLPENFGQIAAGDVVSALKDPASTDGSPRVEVLRALSGTTISIALIDPSKAIHIANVGDCDV